MVQLRIGWSDFSLTKGLKHVYGMLQWLRGGLCLTQAIGPETVLGIAFYLILKQVFRKGSDQPRPIGTRMKSFAMGWVATGILEFVRLRVAERWRL